MLTEEQIYGIYVPVVTRSMLLVSLIWNRISVM